MSSITTILRLDRLFHPEKEPYLAKSICRYPDPERSVGNLKYLPINNLSCWNTVGAAREDFKVIRPRIDTLLNHRYRELELGRRRPLFPIWVFMIGKTKTDANPYILFCCSEVKVRRKARELVREARIMDGFAGFLLGDANCPPILDRNVAGVPSNPILMAGLSQFSHQPSSSSKGFMYSLSSEAGNRTYGVPIKIENIHHHPPCIHSPHRATLGGWVSVGNQCYALTVAHSFNCEDPDTDDNHAISTFEADLDPNYTLSSVDIKIPLEDSKFYLEEIDPVTPLFGPEQTADTRRPESDQSGPRFVSERLNPMIKGMIKESKVSGDVALFASSVLNRKDLGSDWSLVLSSDKRFSPFGAYTLSDSNDIRVEKIAEGGPIDKEVYVLTGWSGIIRGDLSGTPTSMRLSGCDFQEVWTVELDGHIKVGDCGSWVVDADGTLYGHIVAGHPDSLTAYVIPATSIAEDIKKSTGHPMKFVSERDLNSLQNGPSSSLQTPLSNSQDFDSIRSPSNPTAATISGLQTAEVIAMEEEEASVTERRLSISRTFSWRPPILAKGNLSIRSQHSRSLSTTHSSGFRLDWERYSSVTSPAGASRLESLLTSARSVVNKATKFSSKAWPDAEISCGARYWIKSARMSAWGVVGPVAELTDDLIPRIRRLLESRGHESNVQYMGGHNGGIVLKVFMVGKKESSSVPTVVVSSSSRKLRNSAVKTIKESKILDEYPGVYLASPSELPSPTPVDVSGRGGSIGLLGTIGLLSTTEKSKVGN